MYLNKPKVFISYTWEDDVKKWIEVFVKKLEKEGIEVHIDQKLQLGDRLPQFMEKISSVDYVLIICTPTYKEKSDSRQGGVGYEGNIISANLMDSSNERKFILILYKGTFEKSLPNFLLGKYGVDLSATNPNCKKEYKKLIKTLLGKNYQSTHQVKGKSRSLKKTTSNVEDTDTSNEPIHILRILTEEVTMPKMDGTRGSALYKIPFQLSRKPSKVWTNVFIQTWNYPPHCTTMHRPGIAKIDEDRLILNGTTIEEVQKYHNDTLKLCIDKANAEEQEFLNEIKKQKILEEQHKKQHLSNIIKIADEIQF